MYEYIINLHMHTLHSDGSVSHSDLAKIALDCNIDIIIVTDHNVWVNGEEKYYSSDDKRVLVLVGEEIHDIHRKPQKSHLLVFGADKELESLSSDPQGLINAVNENYGLSFIAHPIETAAPAFNEPNISWEDWDVTGYTGLELWNGFSEFKSRLHSKLHGLFYAFNPNRIARGPFPETLRLWDKLLLQGNQIPVIGGSDAHAQHRSLGSIHKILFPYDYHFNAINTHILLNNPLSVDVLEDKVHIYRALQTGSSFIGYDLSASTSGFRFYASNLKGQQFHMGETVNLNDVISINISLPTQGAIHLIHNGRIVAQSTKTKTLEYTSIESGYYRVEVYKRFKGMSRGWIFSNPIYIE